MNEAGVTKIWTWGAVAGLTGVLVKTGYGLGEIEYILPHKTAKPAHIAEDLLDAVRWILRRRDGDQSLRKAYSLVRG